MQETRLERRNQAWKLASIFDGEGSSEHLLRLLKQRAALSEDHLGTKAASRFHKFEAHLLEKRLERMNSRN